MSFQELAVSVSALFLSCLSLNVYPLERGNNLRQNNCELIKNPNIFLKPYSQLSTLRGSVEKKKARRRRGETQRRVKRKSKKEAKLMKRTLLAWFTVGAHLRPFASGLKPAAESISAMYNDRLSQQHGRWPRRQNDGPVTPPQRRSAGNL